jgi:hypothetical protein
MSTTVPTSAVPADDVSAPLALTSAGGPAVLPADAVATVHSLLRTPCYSWCAEVGDSTEPTAHESATAVLAAPSGMTDFAPVELEGNGLLSAILYADDNCQDPSGQVHLMHGAEGFAILAPDEAEAFADQLISFAAQVRGMARQAREQRPEHCSAFSWCAEAGHHVTHNSRELALPAPGGGTYLAAYLMAEESEGNAVTVGFDADSWADLDAAELRAEAAKIRAHCGELEELAGQLECEEINYRLGLNGGEGK